MTTTIDGMTLCIEGTIYLQSPGGMQIPVTIEQAAQLLFGKGASPDTQLTKLANGVHTRANYAKATGGKRQMVSLAVKDQRRKRLLKTMDGMIAKEKPILTEALAKMLNVEPHVIRGDLDALKKSGALTWTRNGMGPRSTRQFKILQAQA